MSSVHAALASLYDALVVPAFCHAGFAARAATWDPRSLEVDLRGRAFLVTGASAGLGRAAAEALAVRGGDVHLVVRDRGRGERARDGMLEAGGRGALHLHLVDVARLSEVRRFADGFVASGRRLDGLIHNAGVLLDRREVTDEGHERTLATNVLAPYLLTGLLEPALQRTAAAGEARVVWVSSGGMYTQRVRVDDLQYQRGQFDGVVAYARTKRAEIYLSERFAARWAGSAITSNAMHPGWADTPGVQGSLPRFHRLTRRFLRTPAEGADTIVWLAASDEARGQSGGFFLDRRPRPTHLPGLGTHQPTADIDRLWQECARLTGWPG